MCMKCWLVIENRVLNRLQHGIILLIFVILENCSKNLINEKNYMKMIPILH